MLDLLFTHLRLQDISKNFCNWWWHFFQTGQYKLPITIVLLQQFMNVPMALFCGVVGIVQITKYKIIQRCEKEKLNILCTMEYHIERLTKYSGYPLAANRSTLFFLSFSRSCNPSIECGCNLSCRTRAFKCISCTATCNNNNEKHTEKSTSEP